MKKSIIMRSCSVAMGGLVLSAVAASAAPIAFTSYGGHDYELYADAITWDAAKTAALSAGGYLAVLTTQGETEAVYSGLINNGFFTDAGGVGGQAWIGGYPTGGVTSTTDPTAWAWVTGEGWTLDNVANFAPGEPNGDSLGLAINRYGTFTFNDEGGSPGGYIVEKNGVPDAGSSLALLGGAFTMLGAVGRRLRK